MLIQCTLFIIITFITFACRLQGEDPVCEARAHRRGEGEEVQSVNVVRVARIK